MDRISSLSVDYDELQNLLMMTETQPEQKAKKAAASIGLDHIQIELVDSRLLEFILRMHRSKKVVEFGTLTGYSALSILAALPPDGHLWTVEKDAKHAQLAREVLADEAARCTVVEGDGVLAARGFEKQGPFDAAFIDANKGAYLDYLVWCESNLRVGGLLIADNILLHGELLGELKRFSLKQRDVMREFLKRLKESENWRLTIAPASDGFAVAEKIR